MNRLFISFYLVVVVGLFTINYISELIWSHYVAIESEEVSRLRQVVELVPKLIEPTEVLMAHVSNGLNVEVNIIPLTQFAWLDEQTTQLEQGYSVINYNEHEQLMLYVQVKNSNLVYQFGPFKDQNETTHQGLYKWGIVLFSYILLGTLIALWIRPLWRDLSQLNTMALSISNGKLDVVPQMNTSSSIHHIVSTFHQMTLRIKRLLDDQHHLVNAVSHELRTPLSRLRFALVMLPDETKESQRHMEQDIKEIEVLVDEMLGYARLENLDQPIITSAVDLVNMINKQRVKLSLNHTVDISFNTPTSLIYECNGKLVERAVQNLVTNAVRYAKNSIVITLLEEFTTVSIIVEDDGTGIDEHEYSNVFEPFYRLEADNAQSSSGGGFGLGLAIVKRILDWHHGHCCVEKSAIGGCKFTLTFPIN